MNRYQNTEQIIDICVQASKMTSEVLQAALRDFLDGKTKKKGKISFEALSQKSGGKLEAINVDNNDIKDFLTVASKYDVDFSLKRDKSIEPPVYHVFFATGKTENFEKAFNEFLHMSREKHTKSEVNVKRSEMQKNAVDILKNYDEKQKNKERTRKREQMR